MIAAQDTIIKINVPISEGSKKNTVNILCLDLTHYGQLTQFLCCCICVFVCYLAYGYYLELIFTDPQVKPISLYITLIQFLITALLSYIESWLREPIKRKVPMKTYVMLAALTLGTMAFSNLALSYLNYPTQLIFKSCKLIPVMIGSIFIMGKRYGFLDYCAAVYMCIGLTMFTLADASSSPNFDLFGVFIISLALICDAIIGNVQEKAMKQFQASNNEVVFYSYSIACCYLLFITSASGALFGGIKYCATDPMNIYSNVVLLSVTGYMGLQAVLTLVRVCGATIAVTVTTMRKAFSIIISFVIFDKPFVLQYVWAGLLIVLAIYLNHMGKKKPNYVPPCVLVCWRLMQSYYSSEYRYLSMRTKVLDDTV